MKHCLQDIRVLEVGQVLAGPYAGMILGDLGADVIKIESPDGGDSARRTPPHFYKGESIYFMTLNRNKKSIVLDLNQEEGREVFYDLVKTSDVVLDNLRPGVPEKLKINHEVLSRYNPKIISCSINGYGSDTPDSHKPSFDLMMQAQGGGMSLTGEPEGPPLRMGVSITDHVAGIYAVTGILAALHAREHTGRGQKIEVPLFSTMISLLSYEAGFCLYSGEAPGPVGSGHRSLIPYNAVKTKDGYIVIDAHLPKFWSALCQVLDSKALTGNPKFESLQARNTYRKELLEILDEAFAKRTSQQWLELLEANGVPCAPINDLRAALNDPATLALNMVVDIEHKGVGLTFKAPGNPIRMSESRGDKFSSPPLLGEHTENILKELLEYPDEKIQRLRQQKSIR
ncbi:CaiB/BaiF CoA transferase family protein [Desulfogranum japonicum]|uniref:CaiB/BaiF CoA transferase family protein n=1 Tax=Desulfogranum japonicum TaxID=231447 RepID=UPI000557BBBB|nr:CoA transferase [Desulfogranum japonicum]